MTVSQALAAAAEFGFDPLTADQAITNLQAGRVCFIGFSGWKGSGKDFIAPQVLTALGVTDPAHVYYAIPLKDETDELLRQVTAVTVPADIPDAVETIAETMGVSPVEAAAVLGMLWAPTRDPQHGLTGRSRTLEVLSVLLYWGTEVRRRQDAQYWVKRALAPAVEALAAGQSVMVTDVRFPNEVSAIQRLGGFVGRLDVTRETQRERLQNRDGLVPDAGSLRHGSETALNTFTGFDVRVSNDGAAQDTVRAFVTAVLSRTVAPRPVLAAA